MNGRFYEHEFREHRKPRARNIPMPSINGRLWEDFDQYLKLRSLDPNLARFNEWYPSTDAGDSASRVVIPCSNSLGRVYWQARLIPHLSQPDQDYKRYQSAHTARAESVVVTWPHHYPAGPLGIALVEGPMDALAASGEGWIGVALMGDKPPPECIEYVVRIFRVYYGWRVVPDTDMPRLGAHVLRALGMLGVKARLVDVQPYKDLASVPPEARGRYLRAGT